MKTGFLPGHLVLTRLSAPVFQVFSMAASAALGHALGLDNVLSDITSAASRVANDGGSFDRRRGAEDRWLDLISHSMHDTAVDLPYPRASRIMWQAASAIVGGPTVSWRYGSEWSAEYAGAFDVRLPVGTAYDLPAGKTVWKLLGDGPAPSNNLERQQRGEARAGRAWLSSL